MRLDLDTSALDAGLMPIFDDRSEGPSAASLAFDEDELCALDDQDDDDDQDYDDDFPMALEYDDDRFEYDRDEF